MIFISLYCNFTGLSPIRKSVFPKTQYRPGKILSQGNEQNEFPTNWVSLEIKFVVSWTNAFKRMWPILVTAET